MSCFFQMINRIQEFLWGYVDFVLILAVGLYFTIKTSFFQFKSLFAIKRTMKALMNPTRQEEQKGVIPWRLCFTSIGGSIGLGNIVAVVSTISIGGPGGLFWMWIAVFLGMLVKYGEVYLGIRYRQPNQEGGYDGGPMYYLNKAFNVKFAAPLSCLLMCIYGVEIFQFKVIEDSLVESFGLNRWAVLITLLLGTGYVTLGGIKRLANVCSSLMPIFLFTYVGLCLYAICQSDMSLGSLFRSVFQSAFTGHAAIGGFAGSSFVMAVQHGMSNAVYSGDICTGYDSVIQAETQLYDPKIQARTVILTLLVDCFICSLTVLLIFSTGMWKNHFTYGSQYVVCALRPHVPWISQLLAGVFFLVGWTTILGYLAVGIKSAESLFQKGQKRKSQLKIFYLSYALLMFSLFSFIDQNQARLMMYLSGGLIVFINVLAVFKLRKEIDFSLD